MSDPLGVPVADLVAVLKRKKARLPFEIGAFVTLEVCEALLDAPAKVTPADVRVGEDGAVSVFSAPNSATNAEAAESVVSLLAHLLVAAGTGVPASLLDLIEHGPSDGKWDLGRLRDELEASLVPLNRGAARRVLSRMLREASGAFTSQSEPVQPVTSSLDAELDELMGFEDEAPPLASSGGRHSRPTPQVLYAPEPVVPKDSRHLGDQVWVDDAQARPRTGDSIPAAGSVPVAGSVPAAPDRSSQVDTAPPPAPDKLREDLSDPFVDEQATVRRGAMTEAEAEDLLNDLAYNGSADSLAYPENPTVRPPREKEPLPAVEGAPPQASKPFTTPGPRDYDDLDLSGLEEAAGKKKSRAAIWAVLILLLTAGLVAGVAFLRPDALARFLGNETPEERAAREREEELQRQEANALEEHRRRFGNLTVNVGTDRAQILMFIGRGPASVADLPIGVAHEFIAIAEGRVPTRAVVPADAEWEESGDGRIYELAVQTGEEEMAPEDLVLGPTRLRPDAMGTPGSEVGAVRVITNPRGAKVYQLIGFAPSAHIQNARTDQPIELLVFAEEHQIRRAMVGPSDWQDDGTTLEATLDLTLEEVP
ncbi:MAG: hypothetical protein AAGF12_30140 [Myxococcota bacterium]